MSEDASPNESAAASDRTFQGSRTSTAEAVRAGQLSRHSTGGPGTRGSVYSDGQLGAHAYAVGVPGEYQMEHRDTDFNSTPSSRTTTRGTGMIEPTPFNTGEVASSPLQAPNTYGTEADAGATLLTRTESVTVGKSRRACFGRCLLAHDWTASLAISGITLFLLAIYLVGWGILEAERVEAWENRPNATASDESVAKVGSVTVPFLIAVSVALLLCGSALGFMFMASTTDPGIVPRFQRHGPQLPIEVTEEWDITPVDKRTPKPELIAVFIQGPQVALSNGLASTIWDPTERKEVAIKIDSWESTLRGVTIRTPYCPTCESARPFRASHCTFCDNCVENFDHHCGVIGACVGRRNVRYFWGFLVSMGLLCSTCGLGCIWCMVLNWDRMHIGVKIVAIVLCFVAGVLGLQVGGMSIMYSILFCRGVTQREDVKFDSLYRDAKGVNPFDQGVRLNLKKVCCP